MCRNKLRKLRVIQFHNAQVTVGNIKIVSHAWLEHRARCSAVILIVYLNDRHVISARAGAKVNDRFPSSPVRVARWGDDVPVATRVCQEKKPATSVGFLSWYVPLEAVCLHSHTCSPFRREYAGGSDIPHVGVHA